jgi:hypothetical protein
MGQWKSKNRAALSNRVRCVSALILKNPDQRQSKTVIWRFLIAATIFGVYELLQFGARNGMSELLVFKFFPRKHADPPSFQFS